MRQRACFEVGDDLFDDRVPEVIGLGGQDRQRCIGEHGVVAAALRTINPSAPLDPTAARVVLRASATCGVRSLPSAILALTRLVDIC